MNKTSIVILTCNNFDYNKLCIQSIRDFTPEGTYEIIVVDNNSTDGTVNWLNSQSDLKIVLNDTNLGFPKGCNQGIAMADPGNDILLLNNDTIVTYRWLDNLKECLYSDPSVGVVGPVTNYCSYHQAIETNFSNIDEMQKFAREFNASANKEYEQRIKLIGFCMLIKREVVNAVGVLDERFTPGNFEDDDYSYRVQEAGYKLLLCNSTFIYHYGSSSFKKDIQLYQNRLVENSKKFEDKWNFNSTYSSNIRLDIINLINEEPIDKVINVLEVGCACGATLLKIKYRYKNAQLFGIELNPNSAKIAAHICEVSNENIESSNLKYENGFFDYIIFADVLEHLFDPGKVLANMRKYLKEDGYILASIPNIMHYSVIAGILGGNFTYADAGILDRTHVRFFTLNEIERLFAANGYTDMRYNCNVLLNEKDKTFIDRLVAISGEDKRTQFSAYQYIVKAKNKSTISQIIERKSRDDLVNGLDETEITDPMSEIAFSLRRIENNVKQEVNIQKLSEILEKYQLSSEQIKEIVVKTSIDIPSGFNIFGVAYYNIGKKQLAVECFLNAHELDNKNMDIIYNVVTLLIECGQNESASTILGRYGSENEVIQKLKNDLYKE